MYIGSMFFNAPAPREVERFFAEHGTQAIEISLPIRPDPIMEPVRRNILDCARSFPGRVALHDVLPMVLAHRHEGFRRRIRERIISAVRLAAEAGIRIFTMHTTVTRTANSLQRGWRIGQARWLARAMDLDVTADLETSERLLVEFLGALGPIARDGGVVLALENNFRDGKFFTRRLDCLDDIRRVLDRAEAPATAICFDIYKAFSTEESPADSIRACGDRIVNVHASDIEHLDTSFHHRRRPICDGRIEWDPVLDALVEIGYDGPIVLEMMATDEDVRVSAQRLRALIGEARRRAG